MKNGMDDEDADSIGVFGGKEPNLVPTEVHERNTQPIFLYFYLRFLQRKLKTKGDKGVKLVLFS